MPREDAEVCNHPTSSPPLAAVGILRTGLSVRSECQAEVLIPKLLKRPRPTLISQRHYEAT